jgi:HEAT repeat protein
VQTNDRWIRAALALFGIAALAVLSFTAFQYRAAGQPRCDGKPLSFWLARLDSRQAPQSQAALRRLGPKALPFILERIRQGEGLYAESVVALRALGPEANPGLIAALNDPSDDVRAAAIATVATVGLSSETQVASAVEALARLVDDPVVEVRFAAILGLGRFGAQSAPAVPVLLSALTNQEEMALRQPLCIRAKSAEALGKIGPAAQSAVPALSELLSGPDYFTSQQAAIALWRIGHDTNLILPVLTQMLDQPEPDARQSAARALARLGNDIPFDEELRRRIHDALPPPLPQGRWRQAAYE